MSKVRLAEVASERRETYKGSKTGFPIVGLEHLTPEEVTLSEWSFDNENTFTKLFRKNDVLFGRRRAYLKKAAVAPFDGICSGDITVIHAKEEHLLPELLPFIIQNDALFDFAVGKSAGSLSPRVKWEHLQNFEFDLPDMGEQRRIADVLWAIDTTKKSYQRLIAATDDLVKSQFMEQFGNLNNTQYEVKTLEEICDIIKDGTHYTPTYTDEDSGVRFLSSKDVVTRYIDWTDNKFIPLELHKELHARIAPQKGDILLAKNGTTGICAIVDRDEVFDIYVSLALLRFKPGHDITYMWAAINMPETKKQFDERLKGIGVPNLHIGEIKQTRIIVPPLSLQEQFAAFVRQSDKSKFELEQALSELTSTYKRIISEHLG